jgi:hypothetical protein
MAEEIRGKLFATLAPKSGSGANGQWVIQEFVIETIDQFPKKVCLEAWNDKANMVKSLAPGAEVIVAFNPESREYNGRWYTSLKVWKIDMAGASAQAGSDAGFSSMPPMPSEAPPMADGDLPF